MTTPKSRHRARAANRRGTVIERPVQAAIFEVSGDDRFEIRISFPGRTPETALDLLRTAVAQLSANLAPTSEERL